MFEQVKLNYDFNALEPYIDALTMETHYSKHHATYTNTFNTLAQQADLTDKSCIEILSNLTQIEDEATRNAIRNNGGGYFNHNLYFSQLSAKGGGEAKGDLGAKINSVFGSFEAFKEKISKAAISQFGSGWAWLSADKEGGLLITQSANQDNPYSMGLGVTPIMNIDVWEHAYYLKYKNLRAKYVEELFNVIDWEIVGENYRKAIEKA